MAPTYPKYRKPKKSPDNWRARGSSEDESPVAKSDDSDPNDEGFLSHEYTVRRHSRLKSVTNFLSPEAIDFLSSPSQATNADSPSDVSPTTAEPPWSRSSGVGSAAEQSSAPNQRTSRDSWRATSNNPTSGTRDSSDQEPSNTRPISRASNTSVRTGARSLNRDLTSPSHRQSTSHCESADNSDAQVYHQDLFLENLERRFPAKLNKDYQRRNGSIFFKRGKVFAALWHEPEVHEKYCATPQTEPVELPLNLTVGPYQEIIFSHIRRFIVVKAHYLHCICVPINTYSDKGLSEKSKVLPASLIAAHAVAYAHGTTPKLLDDEDGITKKPIAIALIKGQSLKETSRINFSKAFTVEWQVKVMDVGFVHVDSMDTLIAHCKEELNIQ